MKRIILISLIVFLQVNVFGQLLDNRANFQIGYETGINLGKELFNNQGIMAPSFYSNFKSLNGITFKGILKLSEHISTGLSTSILYNSDWESQHYSSYIKSNEKSISIKPVFQYHTAFKDKNIFNRLKLYGEVSPVIGFSAVSLAYSNFDVIGAADLKSQLLKSNNIYYGLSLGGGAEYKITNRIGVFANLSIQEHLIESPIYIDNRRSALTLSIGTVLSLAKYKRFNY